MVLEVNDATGGHLDRAEHSHHLQDPVIEAGQQEAVLLPAAAPEVGAAHETAGGERGGEVID